MAIFEFEVQKSFLEETEHPITIPKSQLPYQHLIAADLNHKHILVILPHGERFEAKIYHGEAGYGEYYQIRFNGRERTLPSYLTLEDHLIIVLAKTISHSYAIVEYRE